MSKYTTQLRSYIETGGKIFDFSYPIFDEAYRAVLEKNIIEYYYFREIGLETIGQFKWFLKSKMNRIMPFYNELYESTGLITKDDYFINQNSTETHTRTASSTSTGKVDTNNEGTTTGSGQDVFSDTPQSKLLDLNYATNLSENSSKASDKNTGSSESTGKVDSHQEYIIRTSGGGGLRYNADILMEWRKSFINVDQMIIDELKDLFMNVY